MAESGRFVKKKFPFCINVFSVKKILPDTG